MYCQWSYCSPALSHEFVFSLNSQHWFGTGNWNLFLKKDKDCLSDTVSSTFPDIHPDESRSQAISSHGMDLVIFVWCSFSTRRVKSLQWRHNGRNCISNHQPHDHLLNCLFRRRSKKTSKLCVTGLCAGDSPITSEFPAQMASNGENVSIWLRHHVMLCSLNFVIHLISWKC